MRTFDGDLAQVLRAWLKDHIRKTDVELARFLNDKARTEDGSSERGTGGLTGHGAQ